MTLSLLTARISQFLNKEEGSATIWSIFWSLIFLIVGGLAIDNASAWKTQQELQAVADASSHAGAVELSLINDVDAKAEAVRVAQENIKMASYGNVLVANDVETGNWDHTNRVFTPTTFGADAVRVITRRTSDSNNPLPTFLLRLVGFNSWDIVARSTTQRFIPTCILDGIVADGVAEISSNNTFLRGYCIHGQQGVKISSNNFFEGDNDPWPGVVVSMNDFADLQLPSSGMASNTGLADALAEDWMRPRAVDRIDEWLVDLSDPTNAAQPSFIDPNLPAVNVNNNKFDPKNTVPGTVYNVTCPGNGGQINFPANTHVDSIVLITNCRISTAANLNFTNAVIGTSNTASNSIGSAQGVILGADDNCAPGGGATFISAGGIDYAAKFEGYGSQVIAAGDIKLAAKNNGLEGVSFQTKGDFKMTSNSAMGNCSGNVDLIVVENYYRIVQ